MQSLFRLYYITKQFTTCKTLHTVVLTCILLLSRVVNIGYQSIADTILLILFQYRSRYRQYFPAQVLHTASAILFFVKNLIFIQYFFINNNFFRLDSFFDLDMRVWCQPLPVSRILM